MVNIQKCSQAVVLFCRSSIHIFGVTSVRNAVVGAGPHSFQQKANKPVELITLTSFPHTHSLATSHRLRPRAARLMQEKFTDKHPARAYFESLVQRRLYFAPCFHHCAQPNHPYTSLCSVRLSLPKIACDTAGIGRRVPQSKFRPCRFKQSTKRKRFKNAVDMLTFSRDESL